MARPRCVRAKRGTKRRRYHPGVKGDSRHLLRIGHSPDPDDAFMWWPLTGGEGGKACFDPGRFRFQPVLADIETLNRRAEHGELEITAISCAQYPAVQERYAITSCGCSMGEGYGPKLIANPEVLLEAITRPGSEIIVAVPGAKTSAFATLCVMLGRDRFRYEVVPFDRIIDLVVEGKYQAGLVIHEGQLTWESAGLVLLADLGAWWWEQVRAPLPLGLNVIRRDLDDAFGPGTIQEVTGTLVQSVRHAMAHRKGALQHAMEFARGLPFELVDEFVRLYVNARSIDLDDAGEAAIRSFATRIHEAGLTRRTDRIDVVRPTADHVMT